MTPLVDPTPIDLLILTAANPAQARAARAHLAGRPIPAHRAIVLPDPQGKRIGSGGSTILALHAADGAVDLATARVLILHSGGDSRRLPAYAAQGKIFAPSPLAGSLPGRTLLDDILADLAPLVPKGHAVVASGDVYLNLAHTPPDLSGPGVIGVALPSPPERGTRHGVYIATAAGRVKNFLQKPTLAELRRHRAITDGRVLVDTGVFSFSARAATTLITASTGPLLRALSRGEASLDLYRHVPDALLGRTNSPGSPLLRTLMTRLAFTPFHARTAHNASFVHIGTTREAIDLFTRDSRVTTIACITPIVPPRRGRATAESCLSPSPLTLAPHSLVVNLPDTPLPPIRTQRGFGLVMLPIGPADWTCVRFGIDDDFKSPIGTAAHSHHSILANLARLIAAERMSASALHASDEPDRSLWTARVWSIGTAKQSLADTDFLQHHDNPPHHWQKAQRVSLRDLLHRVNHTRLRNHRDTAHTSSLAAHLAADPTPTRRAALLVAVTETPHALANHPSLPNPRAAMEAAFRAVSSSVATPEPPRQSHAAKVPASILVTCPARIDLAGGWTDTPPICTDLGGLVLNAAIALDDAHPIRVLVRPSATPGLSVSSTDLRRSTRLTKPPAPGTTPDPSRWETLPVAALQLTGLLPDHGSVAAHLGSRIGAPGLDITLASALPKGSGLGGSSILGAALLAALARLTGPALSRDALIRLTSALEQRMSTGGGWQDQAGAILPGVKRLETRPGPNQAPRHTPIDVRTTLTSPDIAPRLLLYYTGQRRLARNILRGVVLRYLRREPHALRTLARLREGAASMHDALHRNDLDAFAAALNEYWVLKQSLDPASSNDLIRGILASVAPHLSAASLPGAGGGGFILMLAKSARHATRIRDVLSARPPNAAARFHAFSIDTRGLSLATT